MKKYFLLFVLTLCTLLQAFPQNYTLRSVVTYIEDDEPPPEVTPQDEEIYLNLEDELLICIAYVEDYSSTAYFCGARWTIGYGLTYYPNNSSVKRHDTIDKLTAQKYTKYHLRKRVFPYVNKYIKRKLTRQELIGTCMFVYNIGSGNFKKSAFLKAVNNGLSPLQCARRMTEFTKSAGRFAPGLVKRSWIQAAIYCDYLSPYDLLDLKPAGFYNESVSYFTLGRAQDGYYNYNFSKLQGFLKKNKCLSHSVFDIL